MTGPLRRFALPVLLAAIGFPAYAERAHYLFLSVGESPYSPASDMAESAIVPQFGYAFEWGMNSHLSSWVEGSLGRHNHGALVEASIGLDAGLPFGAVRPSLYGGVGIQSALDRDFIGPEGEDLVVERGLYYPWELGCKLDWNEIVYTGIDMRVGGFPMWKAELGYRFGGLKRFADELRL